MLALLCLINSCSYVCLWTAEGPSIYLKGLPPSATHALLENEFRKFGTIRAGGIQVKTQKVHSSSLSIGVLLILFATNNYSFIFCVTGILFWLRGIWRGKCCAKCNWGMHKILLPWPFFVFFPLLSYYIDFLHVMCKKQEAFVNLHADGGMKWNLRLFLSCD